MVLLDISLANYDIKVSPERHFCPLPFNEEPIEESQGTIEVSFELLLWVFVVVFSISIYKPHCEEENVPSSRYHTNNHQSPLKFFSLLRLPGWMTRRQQKGGYVSCFVHQTPPVAKEYFAYCTKLVHNFRYHRSVCFHNHHGIVSRDHG